MDSRDFTAIARFIDDDFDCCKQHVYFLGRKDGNPLGLPESLPASSKLLSGSDRAIFIARKQIGVITTDGSMERKTLTFLWPIKVQILFGCLIVKFIVLEKDFSAHVHGAHVIASKGIEESGVLAALRTPDVAPVDIHKGVKALWDDGFMDSPWIKYVEPDSTIDTKMRESRGIRQFKPDLYKLIKNYEILTASFFIDKGMGKSLYGFSVKPGDGSLGIHRFTEKKGDADSVIAEILKCNQ